MVVPSPFASTLLVAAGGAVGAASRYQLGRWIGIGSGFPLATLAANVAGSLAMGLLVGWLARHDAGQGWRLLLGVGLLGGFTTFSSFSLELVLLWQRGAIADALVYASLSLAAGVGALILGLQIVRWAT